MRKGISTLVFLFALSTSVFSSTIYINDASFAPGDWCTSAGSDVTGTGSSAAPFATLSKALSVVAAGDIIRADAGTYINQGGLVISFLNVTIEGYGVSATVFQLTSGTNNFLTVQRNNFKIQNLTIKGYNSNTALQGKALTITGMNGTVIYNVSFEDCLSASGGEPAVYVSTNSNISSTVLIRKCSFMNNIGNYGGAIDVCSNTINTSATNVATIDSCYFENNGKFMNNGGVLNIYNGSNAVAGTQSPVVNLSNSSIGNACTGNQAMRGGAIYIDNGSGLKIDNCCFSNNSAMDVAGPDGGGAIWVGEAQVTINDCKFENNTANTGTPKYGGAIYADAGFNSATLSINSCAFIGNMANRGAGVYAGNVGLKMNNCLLYNNAASGAGSFGGGLAVNDPLATVTIYNGTFSKNSTTGAGRGDAIDGNSGNFSAFEIKNSILYANGANKELAGGTSINVSWSIIGASSVAGTDYTSVTGNSTADPLFTNPANDFTLSGITSPAYNTGDPDGGLAPTVDINSLPRTQFDMGCYVLNSAPALKWTCPNYASIAFISSTIPSFCPGQSATLSALPGTGYTYVWSSSPAGLSATTQTVTVTPTVTTVYFVQVNNATPSCGSYGTASFTLAPGTGPVVDIKPDHAGLCSGTTFNITGAGAATYTWSVSTGTLSPNTGSVVSYTAPTVSVSTTATISCLATSAAGCVNSTATTETIVISPNPTVTPSAFSSALCSGSTTTLTASGASTYTWSSSSGSLSSANGDTITFTAPTVTAVTTVTVTLDGMSDSSCVNQVQGILTLTINPNPIAPTISPGNSSICSGSNITFTGGGVSTYTWSATAGSFNSVNANPVVYTAPSVAVVTTVTVTANGSSSAGCAASIPASVVVTVTPFPLATLSASTDTMCAGGNATLTSNAASTYTWTASPGTLNTYNGTVVFYTAPSTTTATTATITVVGTNSVGCVGTVADTAFIFIHPTPVINVSSTDSSLCSAETPTLSATGANSYTWTTSAGSLSAGTGNPIVYTTPTVTAVTNATVTVNGTSVDGCQSLTPGILTLTLNPSPVISINSASNNVCSASLTTFTASGAATYSWTSTAGLLSPTSGTVSSYAAPNYTTLTTETITVNGTSATGCTVASPASVVVTINPLPQVAATVADTNFCGGTTTTFSASGANTYTWNATSGSFSSVNGTPVTYTAPALLTAATVTVSLTGSSAAGCLSANADTIILYIDPVPQINLSAADSSICSGGSTGLNSSGASTYTWSVSSGTLNSNFGSAVIYTAGSVSVASTVTVSVTGTNTLSCNSSPTILTLTVNPLPVISIVATNTLICSSDTTSLTASGASNYTWTSASGSFNSANANPVIYTTPTTTTNTTVTVDVTGISMDGCTSSSPATVTLTINAEPSPAIMVLNQTLCSGDSVKLNASGASTYTWAASSGNVSSVNGTPVYYTPSATSTVATSTVSLIATNSQGCKNSVPVTATFTTNPVTTPTVTLSGSPGICTGDTLILTSNPGTGIMWNTGATTASITVTTSGIYSVTAVNSFGCPGVSSVITTTLFPTPSNPIIINSGSSILCQGDSVQLSISQPSGATWQPGGQTTSSIYVNASGTYTVSYVDLNGCVSSTATTSILVNPNPILNYSSAVISPAHCNQMNGSINGISVSSGSGPFTYTWYDTTHTVVQTGNTINLDSAGPGTYSLVVTDFHNCVANGISEVVPNLPGIQVTLSGTPLSGTNPLTVTYDAVVSVANINGDYTWNYGEGALVSTSSNQPQHTYNDAGDYNAIVMVADSFGCKASDTIHIHIDEVVSITVPNIFSPNGDGLNDGFSIMSSGIKNIAITIFDRWGKQMIELEGNSIFWDGDTNQGRKVPDGTYYYIVNYTTNDGKAKNLTGFITLVR